MNKIGWLVEYTVVLDQRRSHGGILGILGSPREPHGPQAYMGPGRSMNCMAEEGKRVSGNGHLA